MNNITLINKFLQLTDDEQIIIINQIKTMVNQKNSNDK